MLVEEGGRIIATHPLLTATTYATATHAARRRVHARLAGAATEPEERARHLTMAITTTDEGAAQAIEAGAMAALSRGAPSAAADLLAAAARLAIPEPATEARLATDEAMARLASGEVSEARALAERALDVAPTVAGRLAILSRVADIAWADGAIEREWDRIHAAIPQTDDAALELELRTKLVAFGVAMAPRETIDVADAALALVDESRQPGRAGYLLISREMASALAGSGIDWDRLGRGVELEESQGRAEGMSSPPLVMYVMSDRIGDARRRFALEAAWYADRGDEGWLAERQSQLALAELRAGNTQLATELSEASSETLQRIGAVQGWPLVFAWRSLVDAHLGRLDRATATIRRTIDQHARGDDLWGGILESVRAFVAHAAGDDATTARAVERMRAAMHGIGVRDLLADRSESYFVEVPLAQGDLAGAEDVVRRLESRHAALPRPWTAIALHRGQALLLAARGDLLGALDSLDRSDPDDLRRLPFEHGWSLLARGRILRRMREKSLAATTLREARGRSCGSRPAPSRRCPSGSGSGRCAGSEPGISATPRPGGRRRSRP